MIDERAARDGIQDMVPAEGTAVFFFKGMSVTPKAIGAAALFIDKTGGRGPRDNFGAPKDGEAMNANLVVDGSADAHGDFSGGEDAEIEPRGSEGFQIVGIGKKGENFSARLGQPEVGFKDVSRHASSITGNILHARRFALERIAE